MEAFEPIALPVPQAAKLIGRSASLLYQEIRLGRLPAYEPDRGYRTHAMCEHNRPRRLTKYVLVSDLRAWVTHRPVQPLSLEGAA